MNTTPALHFVGFRGDEYWRAKQIFGPPDFIHIRLDTRRLREIATGDTVVIANNAQFSRVNGPDIIEEGYF